MKNLVHNLTSSYLVVAICIIIALLLLLVWFALCYGRRTYVRRQLSLIAIDVIENVVLKDAVDEDVVIDFLLLQPDKITAVTHFPYEGIIFAAQEIDVWTQVLAKGSYKFVNPYQIFDTQKEALQQLFPNSTIECKLFFPHAHFPKDKPAAVIELHDLPKKKQYKWIDIQALPAHVATTWQQQKNVAQ